MKRFLTFFYTLVFSGLVALMFTVATGVNPVIPFTGSLVLGLFIPRVPGVALGMLFTAAGGIGTAFAADFKGLPQFLTWNDGGNPINFLQVETKEDGVIHNIVAAGIAVINGYMCLGALPANTVILRIANGFLKDKNVRISGTTSAVGAINFYGASDCFGTAMFKTTAATIIAAEPTVFQNFTAIWTPTMATVTDYAMVEYQSGLMTKWEIEDLTETSAVYQDAPQIMLNNINMNIHRATYVCAANTPAYILKVA